MAGGSHHSRKRVDLNSPEAVRKYLLERCDWQDHGFETPCLVWRHAGAVRYAVTTLQGKNHRVHRLSYAALVGPIPDGLTIDHLCMVKGCCNPDHLEAVTPEENVARALAARPECYQGAPRQAQCGRGHAMIGKNIALRPNGHRYCRACHRETEYARRSRQRAIA